jgi:hypothetical protein
VERASLESRGESEGRRLVVRGKIVEGFHRLDPDVPVFSASSPEADAAEAELNLAIVSYERGETELSDVRRAWSDWVRVQIEASKPKLLFEF